ncbi:hypothetical protein KORDIASMS9_00952 [Kordia sp. SMS9]|uniref:ADP-ribosylation/crystallin J1 n=1 Tax=Kordia sp. SMS9 TaxID=2282170 RepID=UPI000E0CC214|nr:ADP-ribosylation/crystallin J1 [Kordia sp. SMS9]AXG68736.1 hypothetical protein KORDIASMS9_00952 [Kordia sp. SMS9]
MKTLYRPTGLKELELIADINFKGFPPRLEWQPIFYPVLNEQYAIEIAQKWNTKDESSGYIGIVTAFDVNEHYLNQFEVQNVGSAHHNEFWIPAEELEKFNQQIMGEIRVTKAFLGKQFVFTENEEINKLIRKHEIKHTKL